MRPAGNKVLIAYATRYGSTGEVAQAVGSALSRQGVDVEVKPAKDVTALDAYGGVVLATPFYFGSMLKGATRFLERNRDALRELPVALLACGPISAGDDMAVACAQLDDALAKLGWLEPVASAMFVGKYDPAHLRFADKIVAALPASPLHGVAAHDDRDWEAIQAWAEGLPAAFVRARRPGQ
jgi:menaquinone-dependent protoporphyrinogen oxidase